MFIMGCTIFPGISMMRQIIYGLNAVKEWLESDLSVLRLLISREGSGKSMDAIYLHAKRKNIQIDHYARSKLDEMLRDVRHQGVAAEVELPPYSGMEDIFAIAMKREEPPFIAILDDIQDPRNLGAIIRSADGAGVHGIIVPRDKAAGLTPSVVKTSAGAAAYVPIVRVTNLVRTIQDLKKEGLWFVGCEESTQSLYHEIDLKGPVGIVFGSEGAGIRRLVKEQCDFLTSIPMLGKMSSLNVSVAAAILFYEVRRQRQ
jgi:23S rRNA (guanosine2251-2'-O)-methyltransferase